MRHKRPWPSFETPRKGAAPQDDGSACDSKGRPSPLHRQRTREKNTTMTKQTGGEAIVSGLVAHGVDTVFGLPGAQIYGLFDAFQQAQLKGIGAPHEQACGYM